MNAIGFLLTEKTATPSIAEIIDVIGPEATQRLCECLGGTKRSIGMASTVFVEAIGPEAAAKLRGYWGTGNIYIPRRATSSKARHAEIRRMRREGETITGIALVMQVSERQVYNVLAEAKATQAQR